MLLLLSAEPGEGKSMLVSNLAYTLAESGKTVAAVDCNLRSPKLNRLFGLSNQIGLTDVLEQKASLNTALQKSHFENISVLTSGIFSNHPTQLLGSPQMSNLIATLRQQFDYVLLDSPAFLAVPDTLTLTQYADGLLPIIRRTFAKQETFEEVNLFLAGFHEKVIGLIVNQAEDTSSSYSYPGNQKTINKFVFREN